MIKMIKITTIGILAIVTQSFAGFDHGGGGSVIDCRGVSVPWETIQSLDLYEGVTIYKLQPEVPLDGSPVERTALLVQRLAKYDQERATLYLGWLSTFMEEARFLKGTTLPPIKDYGYIHPPTNCQIRQLVIQGQPTVKHEGRYLIDSDLWDLMGNQQRAAMILHELVYRDAIRRGHKDSKLARYFTALVASSGFEKLSIEEYALALKESVLDAWTMNQVNTEYRFYDFVVGTYNEMQTFCRTFPGDSSLRAYSLAGLNRYPLGQHLLQLSRVEERSAWLTETEVIDLGLHIITKKVTPDTRAHAMCQITHLEGD